MHLLPLVFIGKFLGWMKKVGDYEVVPIRSEILLLIWSNCLCRSFLFEGRICKRYINLSVLFYLCLIQCCGGESLVIEIIENLEKINNTPHICIEIPFISSLEGHPDK